MISGWVALPAGPMVGSGAVFAAQAARSIVPTPPVSPGARSSSRGVSRSATALNVESGVDLAPNLVPEGETFEQYLARRTSDEFVVSASRRKVEYGRPGWDNKRGSSESSDTADLESWDSSLAEAVAAPVEPVTRKAIQYGRDGYTPKSRRSSSAPPDARGPAHADPAPTSSGRITYGREGGYDPRKNRAALESSYSALPATSASPPARDGPEYGRPAYDPKARAGLESSYSALPATSATAAAPVPLGAPPLGAAPDTPRARITYGREGGYDPKRRAASLPPQRVRSSSPQRVRFTYRQGKLVRVVAKAVAFVAHSATRPAGGARRKIDYKVGGWEPARRGASSPLVMSYTSPPSETSTPPGRQIEYGLPGYEKSPVPARSYAPAPSTTGKIAYGRPGYTPAPRAAPAPSVMHAAAASAPSSVAPAAASGTGKIVYGRANGYTPSPRPSSAAASTMHAAPAAPAVGTRKIDYGRPGGYAPKTERVKA